jgi:hypothetical protein
VPCPSSLWTTSPIPPPCMLPAIAAPSPFVWWVRLLSSVWSFPFPSHFLSLLMCWFIRSSYSPWLKVL